ncbi:MAG: hypothetical protein ACLFUL_06355 [Desulfobacteraceae bacterium]
MSGKTNPEHRQVKRSPNILKGIREIADFLGVGQDRAYRLIDAGMPVAKIGGYLWAATHEIEAWVVAKSREN